MSRRAKIISVLVVACLLIAGVTTTVLAQEETETTPPSEEATEKDLLDRVADILGIEKVDLVNAFQQAQQEMAGDAFIRRINEAVADGRITQEQADEVLEWWANRPEAALRSWWGLKPEVLEPGVSKNALRFRISPKFHMQNGLGGRLCPKSTEPAD